MREIKFRGKRKDNGEWVYGWFVGNYTANYAYVINWDHIEHTGDECRYEVTPGTVGQYTGLKDKNGVEIYEGDILANWTKKCKPIKGKEKEFYAEMSRSMDDKIKDIIMDSLKGVEREEYGEWVFDSYTVAGVVTFGGYDMGYRSGGHGEGSTKINGYGWHVKGKYGCETLHSGWCSVLGNIHENPDLIQQQ